MKRICLILVGVSMLLGACKKYLNTEPTDFLAENYYYDTETKLNMALAGVYQPLTNRGLYGSAIFSEFGVTNDEAHCRWSYTTSGPIVNDFDAGIQPVNDFWKWSYIGIERANVLLDNINLAPMSAANRSVIEGEALFLRAYYHFLLASYYGDIPLKIKRTPNPLELQQARTPIKEVYAQIIADMTKAIPLVKKSSEWGFAGRVSKTVIQGILARICLTRAGAAFTKENDSEIYYKEALKWATEVVNSGEHSLLETYDATRTNSAYSQVFINAHENKYFVKESMWEIEFFGNGVDGKGNLGTLGSNIGIVLQNSNPTIIQAYGYNYAALNANSDFYNAFEAGDLRRDWAIAPYNYAVPTEAPIVPLAYKYIDYVRGNNGAGNNGHCVGKWRREFESVEASPTKNNGATPINFQVLRYADVLLMLAEAENAVNGPTPVAYNAINQVRRRGFGLPVGAPAAPVSAIKTISLSEYGYGGGRGYLKGINILNLKVTDLNSPALGAGAVLKASVDPSNGSISGVYIANPGKGYTNGKVAVEFPNPWPSNTPNWTPQTAYKVNDYVKSGVNYYKVTVAGTSTATAPTNGQPGGYPGTSGQSLSNAATTGAVFEWAQPADASHAQARIVVETTKVDLDGLDKISFLEAVKKERSKELCFEGLRKQDLVRWGDFLAVMQNTSLRFKAINHFGHLAFTNVAPRHLLLPIPSPEISVNKLATQNPGW